MLHVTLRGLRSHLARLLMTAAAVMLGVSFVTGTFVLRASIDGVLGGLVARSAEGLDVSVRAAETGATSPVTAEAGDAGRGVTLSLVDTIAAVPGVARAVPALQGSVVLAGGDGEPVRNTGAPTLGFAFVADDPSFELVEGRAPVGPGEVAVESSTLLSAGLAVGDRTRAVVGDRARSVVVTREVEFGSLFGATAVLVDPEVAQRAFAPDGSVGSIWVTALPGTDQSTLAAAIDDVLPAGLEAVTGATVLTETEDSVESGLGFFTVFLLAFAGVALFVGSFIIVNTFSVLVAQRSRELALLRAIGATAAQVTRSVLAEAVVVGVVVGVVGSALGIALGYVIAAGAMSVVGGVLGSDLDAELPLDLTTVGLSVLVGVLVTVVAAVLPARRASRVAPVAAMRGESGSPDAAGVGRRGLLGLALLVVAAVALGWSVTRDQVSWPVVATAASCAVLAMLVQAPALARPVVRVVAWPLVALARVVGPLARENALRAPRRTAATASALMIGLALITGLSVLGQSVKASVRQGVADELTSDFVLASGTVAPVPRPVARAVRSLPEVASVAQVSTVDLGIGDFRTAAAAVRAVDVAQNVEVTVDDGRLVDVTGRVVLVDRSTAAQQDWAAGDVLTADVGTLTSVPLTVGGVYRDSQAFGSHVIVDRALYRQALPAAQQVDGQLLVRARPDADLEALRAELSAVVEPYLIVSVQDRAEFVEAQGSSVDTLLNLLYVLLLFSVVVAVLGIVNTLALSVLERTREIGLLRAVGVLRRQMLAMVTIEAVVTSAFGAVLGVVLGLGLGVAMQQGLVSEGLTTLAVPWGVLLLLLLLGSGAVGVLAAVLPAVRAARMDVLRALTGAA